MKRIVKRAAPKRQRTSQKRFAGARSRLSDFFAGVLQFGSSLVGPAKTAGVAAIGVAIVLALVYSLGWLPSIPDGRPKPPHVEETVDFIVGVTDNDARTPAIADILLDGNLYEWLNTSHIKFRVVDMHTAEFKSERYSKDLADAKISPPAAIKYHNGKVLGVTPATAIPTSDAVKAWILGKQTVDDPVHWDSHADSLVYDQDGHKRYLNRLNPDKTALVPLKKAVRWSDAKAIIPREQWKDISKRVIFPAADWTLDQDGIGECVGCGASQALRKVRFISGMTDHKLSPGALYAQINGGRDNGAVIGDSMTALTQTGTCAYETVGIKPFYLKQLPANWKTEAARFKIAEAYVTPTFDEMMSAIQLGYVVVYGMQVGNNFGQFTPEGVAGVAAGPGNHCMHADGCHRLANGQWAFDNCNSWGTSWGPWKNGRCYLVEAHFAHADTRDAYAIKAATLDPLETNKPIAKSKTTETEVVFAEPAPPAATSTTFSPGFTYTSPATVIFAAPLQQPCNGPQCPLPATIGRRR